LDLRYGYALPHTFVAPLCPVAPVCCWLYVYPRWLVPVVVDLRLHTFTLLYVVTVGYVPVVTLLPTLPLLLLRWLFRCWLILFVALLLYHVYVAGFGYRLFILLLVTLVVVAYVAFGSTRFTLVVALYVAFVDLRLIWLLFTFVTLLRCYHVLLRCVCCFVVLRCVCVTLPVTFYVTLCCTFGYVTHCTVALPTFYAFGYTHTVARLHTFTFAFGYVYV